MASLTENADVHYREALDCLNEIHSPRMDALSAPYQQEACHNLMLEAIAQSLTGILALQLNATRTKEALR